jgi:hypothetical protein
LSHGFKLAGRAILRVEFGVKWVPTIRESSSCRVLNVVAFPPAHCFVFSHSSAFFEIKISTNKLLSSASASTSASASAREGAKNGVRAGARREISSVSHVI